MEQFITISGWIFGMISCICAIIQTVLKNKYKKISENNYNHIKQKAVAKGNGEVSQKIGGD